MDGADSGRRRYLPLPECTEFEVVTTDGRRDASESVASDVAAPEFDAAGVRSQSGDPHSESFKAVARYEDLFDHVPIALWLEDLSGVKEITDGLRARGIENWREYFLGHPEVVAECLGAVKVCTVSGHR